MKTEIVEKQAMEMEKSEQWEKQQETYNGASRNNYVLMGSILSEIQKTKAYTCEHPTFREAVKMCFDLTSGRAYHFIYAYEMHSNFAAAGIPENLMPLNEAQCRALRSVARRLAQTDKKDSAETKDQKMLDKAVEIWQDLTKGGKIPNASEITAVSPNEKKTPKAKSDLSVIKGIKKSLQSVGGSGSKKEEVIDALQDLKAEIDARISAIQAEDDTGGLAPCKDDRQLSLFDDDGENEDSTSTDIRKKGNSNIAWTKYVCEVVGGCTQVSEACNYCWAKCMNFQKGGQGAWSNEVRTIPENLDKIDKAEEYAFVASRSDLFHNKFVEKHVEYLKQVFGRMQNNQNTVFQLLTKRADNMALIAGDLADASGRWPANVWAGVTVENAKHIDRIKTLQGMAEPCVKWVSFEPLLGDIGPVDLSGIDWAVIGGLNINAGWENWQKSTGNKKADCKAEFEKHGIPDHYDEWVSSLVKTCKDQGVAVFVKQGWGGMAGSKLEHFPKINGQRWYEMPNGCPLPANARDDLIKLGVSL